MMTLIVYVFPKLQTAKYVVRQMSKNPCFRTPFYSEHVKESQTLLNLRGKTFITFIHPSVGN